MHSTTGLGGPLWVFAAAFYVGSLLFAVFITTDSLRKARQSRLRELPEPQWLYTLPSIVFLAAAALVQIAPVPPIAIAASLSSPVIVVLGFVYLLRVVFPRPANEEDA